MQNARLCLELLAFGCVDVWFISSLIPRRKPALQSAHNPSRASPLCEGAVAPVGGSLAVDALPLWGRTRRQNHCGLAARQALLAWGNEAFSPPLRAELITAHNHTENVASVIKRAGELPQSCYSNLTPDHKKGGLGSAACKASLLNIHRAQIGRPHSAKSEQLWVWERCKFRLRETTFKMLLGATWNGI